MEQHAPEVLEGQGNAAPGAEAAPSLAHPAAPPTTPGVIVVRRRRNWSTVIGVISIVLGSLGVVGSAWNGVGLFIAKVIRGTLVATGGTAQAAFAGMDRWMIPLAISHVLMCGVAFLLIVAGVKTNGRSPIGRKLHIVWAWLKILVAILSSILGVLIQQTQLEAMQASSGSSGNGTAGISAAFSPILTMVTVAIGICWQAAYPTFILIWFARPSIREEVARWTANKAR
jgi:preprotein translocase subunit SecG